MATRIDEGQRHLQGFQSSDWTARQRAEKPPMHAVGSLAREIWALDALAHTPMRGLGRPANANMDVLYDEQLARSAPQESDADILRRLFEDPGPARDPRAGTEAESSQAVGRDHDSGRESLKRTLESANAILNGLADRLPPGAVEAFRRRLADLLDPEDWDFEDAQPSIQSFRHLSSFLAQRQELRIPALTISNAGNFTASWLRTRENVVHLEFDERGWVKWIVFLAAARHGEHSERGTGSVPSEKVRQAVEAFDVWHWMSRSAR